MIERDFHWVPLFVLLTWIVTCGFMWLNSAKGRAPDKRTSLLERSRNFARFFMQVPAWHKRKLERIVQEDNNDRRHMLERQAHQVAFRNGVGAPGPREHFIVICLWFYDRPEQMRSEWPELYDQMSLITGSDPVRMRLVPMSPQPA